MGSSLCSAARAMRGLSAGLAMLFAAAAGAQALDDGDSIYLSVMPPGNNGNSAGGIGLPVPGLPAKYPAHFIDQESLYADLGYAAPNLRASPCQPPRTPDEHLAASDLACNYFKREGLQPDHVESSERLQTPYGGVVTIRRDGWGVPFVDGPTRREVMYGFGYAQAEDRLWLLDVLRNVGRGQLTRFLGPAAEFSDIDASLADTAGYSEAELTQMFDATVAKFGDLGAFLAQDVDADIAGINAFIDSLSGPNRAKRPPEYAVLKQGGFPPAPFSRNDIVASAIFVQSLFAVGGGSESSNALLLQKLDPSIGAATRVLPKAACELWRDLRHADDADATRTTDRRAHQSPAQLDEQCPQLLPPGAALWDVGSYRAFDAYNVGATASLTAARNRGVAAASAPPPPPYERLRRVLRDAGYGLPNSLSNWMAVTAAHTKSGHPIGVMGPQTSYFEPELLWEVSLRSHGGTTMDFDGRGIVFANLPYILIGRGSHYAWSATSGDSDLIDTRVSLLCNLDGSPASRELGADGYPQGDGYLYDVGDGQGPQCRPLYKRHDQWTAKPTLASIGSGGPLQAQQVDRYVLRTHYGPVFATATVSGRPVVISTQRSTFFNELDTAAGFAYTATDMPLDARRFRELFNGVTGTFNWLYVDEKDVAYVQSGLFPLRDRGQSPDLPVWGDGRYEWASDRDLSADFFSTHGGDIPYPGRVVPLPQRGGPLAGGYLEWAHFLPLAAHPQDLNPEKGYIVSWNNSPARGWWAADNHANWAAVHRVDTEPPRFQAFIASGRRFDFANVVEIMADSGYTDLRAQTLLPLLLQTLQAGPLDDTQQQIAASMQQWLDAGSRQWIDGQPGLGGWRRDRDADGHYDARQQAVLMDAWSLHLLDRLTPQLAELSPGDDTYGLTSCSSVVLLCRYDAPRGQGSAFEFGWYQVMVRMLQTALKVPGHPAYRALRCAGREDFASCRSAVLGALDEALADLGGWRARAFWSGRHLPNAAAKAHAEIENYDQIEFEDFSLLPVPSMPWVNRPTFQQVVEIRR